MTYPPIYCPFTFYEFYAKWYIYYAIIAQQSSRFQFLFIKLPLIFILYFFLSYHITACFLADLYSYQIVDG